MPTIRKIRTVVRSKDAPVETDYVIVSVKHVKGTCPGSPEYATLPIKYYFDNERPKCINTINKIITKNELSIHFVEKYNVEETDIEITCMHSEPDGYQLFLVRVLDFDCELENMKSSISLEMFRLNKDTGTIDADDRDIFQRVIKYHQEFGTSLKKNQFSNKNSTTKVKPLKLWKTMTGTL